LPLFGATSVISRCRRSNWNY